MTDSSDSDPTDLDPTDPEPTDLEPAAVLDRVTGRSDSDRRTAYPADPSAPKVTIRLPCALWRDDESGCSTPAVVAVQDPGRLTRWGCEPHAAAALAAMLEGRIGHVHDGDAARRLLNLPWNRRPHS